MGCRDQFGCFPKGTQLVGMSLNSDDTLNFKFSFYYIPLSVKCFKLL